MEKTKYASAERSEIKKLIQESGLISQIEYIDKLINSLPYIAAILNTNREIVFANDTLLELLDLKSVREILGQRPGEFLHCINAWREIGGCGTSENCSVCGAVNCILAAQQELKKTTAECRITAKIEDKLIAYEFSVTTTPFVWKKEVFYVFSLIDISSEKRRRAMEKIFFHDIINKTGSMYGLIDLLKNETDLETIHKFINFLDSINRDLTNEVKSQRDLSAAENGELNVKSEELDSLSIIASSISQISQHEVAKNKMIVQDSQAHSIRFISDGTLIRRILMNMIKNALEAINAAGAVSVGCSRKGQRIQFWVHNDSVIPNEYQLQIFQRSFSTKGSNRGLGTYSMKLIGEQYLKGKVDFISNKEKGTVFYLELPLKD